MKDNETIILVALMVLAFITVVISLTVNSHLNNKMRTEILLTCIQSDSCSNSMEKELESFK